MIKKNETQNSNSMGLYHVLPFIGIANNNFDFASNGIDKDTSKVVYEVNCVFSLGGASKLALFLPKVIIIKER